MDATNNKSITIADGFVNHKDYSDFIKDKYHDVSVAILKGDFEMIKKTIRELIDNSFAYHSNVFKFKIDDEKEKELHYSEYYEIIVDSFEEALVKEQKQNKTPEDFVEIANSKDIFIKESRRIRRLIMKDLATANITPTPRKKKIETIAEKFRGVAG